MIKAEGTHSRKTFYRTSTLVLEQALKLLLNKRDAVRYEARPTRQVQNSEGVPRFLWCAFSVVLDSKTLNLVTQTSSNTNGDPKGSPAEIAEQRSMNLETAQQWFTEWSQEDCDSG